MVYKMYKVYINFVIMLDEMLLESMALFNGKLPTIFYAIRCCRY